MSKHLFFTFLCFVCGFALIGAPAVVSAAAKKAPNAAFQKKMYNPKKVYKDEKIAIVNPTSKCDTPTMRSLHATKLALAQKDAAKWGVATSTATKLGEVYRDYWKGLGTAWEAMTLPYCGYGSMGISAVKHSYEKTVSRLRDTFVTKATQLKKKGEADMWVDISSTTNEVSAVTTTTNSSSAFIYHEEEIDPETRAKFYNF
jgi:hypothetical protein